MSYLYLMFVISENCEIPQVLIKSKPDSSVNLNSYHKIA